MNKECGNKFCDSFDTKYTANCGIMTLRKVATCPLYRPEEKTIDRVVFRLTDKQNDKLQPIFEKANDMLGVVFAQIFDTEDGPGFIEVRFVEKDVAMNVQRAMGVKPGKLHPGITFIETDV